MKIGVVNISIGNVGSVVAAFEYLRQHVRPIDDPEKISKYDIIVLAGVGNFHTAMRRLRRTGFYESLSEHVFSGKYLLGICLGMQLFADVGFEDGETEGFAFIPGKVVKISEPSEKIPHMGWNYVTPVRGKLFNGIDKRTFYFMHSYHFNVVDDNNVIASVDYGRNKMVAAVHRDNIYGVQFHPEKSQSDGLFFLKNLLEAIP